MREEVYGDMRPLSLSSLLSRRETAWRPLTPIHVRNGAAMALAATSGATDAIGYLTLGHVFTSAMTGNLVLLGISLGHSVLRICAVPIGRGAAHRYAATAKHQ